MKVKNTNPDLYKFVTQKFKFSDADIIGLQSYIVNFLPKDMEMSVKTNKITFATDYMCNLFFNQEVI